MYRVWCIIGFNVRGCLKSRCFSKGCLLFKNLCNPIIRVICDSDDERDERDDRDERDNRDERDGRNNWYQAMPGYGLKPRRGDMFRLAA